MAEPRYYPEELTPEEIEDIENDCPENVDLDTLIKAFQLFRKYGNPTYPCHCEHDVLYVNIHPDKVSKEDCLELLKLGFFPGQPNEYPENPNGFITFAFGSC